MIDILGFVIGQRLRTHRISEPDTPEVPVEPEEVIITLSTTLPTATSSMGSAAVGNKVYLFGGNTSNAQDLSNTIRVFDTENQTIKTLSAKLPSQAVLVAAAAIGTKIYLFGGTGDEYDPSVALDTINVFDAENQTIKTLTTKLPTAAYGIAAAAIGTKVYLFGGAKNGSGDDAGSDIISVFDTETETISILDEKLPAPLSRMGVATVGSKVYLFGGEGPRARWKSIRMFDAKNQTVTTLATELPTYTMHINAALLGSKIYLFGGYDINNNRLKTINVFDPEAETLDTLSVTLPKALNGIAAQTVNNKVYLFGGRDGYTWSNAIYMFY